jgi:transcriptional regulator with XRE-family HTH domain
MPPDRYTARRRTQRQVQADERAGQLAAFLGRSLLDARRKRALTQAMAAERAGISQSAWSSLERGRGAGISLRVWERACDAVYADLRAYLEGASAAEQPRDAAHLREQELVARIAAGGGWSVGSEAAIGGAGVADLVLRRPSETALVEIWNWFADVGDAFRSWDRKLERLAASGERRASGCWVVRATRRNRDLVATHRTIFGSRFPGSPASWLVSLGDPARPMPPQPAILWVSVKGDRLFSSRGVGARP